MQTFKHDLHTLHQRGLVKAARSRVREAESYTSSQTPVIRVPPKIYSLACLPHTTKVAGSIPALSRVYPPLCSMFPLTQSDKRYRKWMGKKHFIKQFKTEGAMCSFSDFIA